MDNHKLIEIFADLLQKELKEQRYQEFLEMHPQLIPREFIQNHGIHFDMVFRKLSLARDYVSDFFYLSKSTDDWNCIMIEIEKPYSKFFKNGSNEFHQNFIDGISQIRRWRAWFEDNSNKDNFINNTLRSVRVPQSMSRNPCYLKYVLVHGRREEYQDNYIRSGLIRAEERDDFKIITYDSLMENLNSKCDLYIAVKKNEYIDIISERFVSEILFSWVSPSVIRINQSLKDDILNNKSLWHRYHINEGNMVLALEQVLPQIKVIE